MKGKVIEDVLVSPVRLLEASNPKFGHSDRLQSRDGLKFGENLLVTFREKF